MQSNQCIDKKYIIAFLNKWPWNPHNLFIIQKKIITMHIMALSVLNLLTKFIYIFKATKIFKYFVSSLRIPKVL